MINNTYSKSLDSFSSIRKRKNRGKRFKYLCAVFSALIGFLFFAMLVDLAIGFLSSLRYYRAEVEVTSLNVTEVADEDVYYGYYREFVSRLLSGLLDQIGTEARDTDIILDYIISEAAIDDMQNFLLKEPSEREDFVSLTLRRGFFKDEKYKEISEKMLSAGYVKSGFSLTFFTRGDSICPEKAGIGGSITGTFLTMVAFVIFSVPIGVAAGAYLSSFSRKNPVVKIIEVLIFNLAAIPTVVYGLVSLSLFVITFSLPRASPITAGLTLSIIALPVIIITSRDSLKSIPRSIKEASLALGASENQFYMHHAFPAAAPQIISGIILSLARVMGETTPLSMIGMLLFISDGFSSMADAATTLPIRVYIWSKNPDTGFHDLASGAILTLAAMLAILNYGASRIYKLYFDSESD